MALYAEVCRFSGLCPMLQFLCCSMGNVFWAMCYEFGTVIHSSFGWCGMAWHGMAWCCMAEHGMSICHGVSVCRSVCKSGCKSVCAIVCTCMYVCRYVHLYVYVFLSVHVYIWRSPLIQLVLRATLIMHFVNRTLCYNDVYGIVTSTTWPIITHTKRYKYIDIRNVDGMAWHGLAWHCVAFLLGCISICLYVFLCVMLLCSWMVGYVYICLPPFSTTVYPILFAKRLIPYIDFGNI